VLTSIKWILAELATVVSAFARGAGAAALAPVNMVPKPIFDSASWDSRGLR